MRYHVCICYYDKEMPNYYYISVSPCIQTEAFSLFQLCLHQPDEQHFCFRVKVQTAESIFNSGVLRLHSYTV